MVQYCQEHLYNFNMATFRPQLTTVGQHSFLFTFLFFFIFNISPTCRERTQFLKWNIFLLFNSLNEIYIYIFLYKRNIIIIVFLSLCLDYLQ